MRGDRATTSRHWGWPRWYSGRRHRAAGSDLATARMRAPPDAHERAGGTWCGGPAVAAFRRRSANRGATSPCRMRPIAISLVPSGSGATVLDGPLCPAVVDDEVRRVGLHVPPRRRQRVPGQEPDAVPAPDQDRWDGVAVTHQLELVARCPPPRRVEGHRRRPSPFRVAVPRATARVSVAAAAPPRSAPRRARPDGRGSGPPRGAAGRPAVSGRRPARDRRSSAPAARAPRRSPGAGPCAGGPRPAGGRPRPPPAAREPVASPGLGSWREWWSGTGRYATRSRTALSVPPSPLRVTLRSRRLQRTRISPEERRVRTAAAGGRRSSAAPPGPRPLSRSRGVLVGG